MAVISKDDYTWGPFGSAPLIVTLVLPLVIGVILLVKCILNHCCVRKTTTKEEMYGVEGRMTILPNVETSFVTTPLQSLPQTSTLPNFTTTTTNNVNNSQIQSLKPLTFVPTTSRTKSPIESFQQQRRLISYERSESQQSHRSSTKSSSTTQAGSSGAPATAVLIPNISPAALSSSSSHQHRASSSIEPQASDSCETVVSDLTDSLKRSTLHRQLPDLPHLANLQGHNPPRRSSSVLSHDGNSELYATVGDVPNAANISSPSGGGGGGLEGRSYYSNKGKPGSVSHPSTSRGIPAAPGPSSSGVSKNALPPHGKNSSGASKIEPTPSSDSETYAINHPYAKLKRNVVEHPYARVRTGSTGTGGDEETDTDNYDTPQPYAQTGRNNNNLMRNSQQPGSSSGAGGSGGSSSGPQAGSGEAGSDHHASSHHGSSNNTNPADANRQPGNPVPPRRTGRQWRRSSHPQGQINGTQQQHFSGDSQDSRGYTSISVREPLSNIIANRSEVANIRNYDSHYATVSDDSEEMYAAIEDSDGNYMRIPGEDGESGGRHWHERREANSPLPPPPPVPPLASPPEHVPTTGPAAMDQSLPGSHASSGTNAINPAPPLYAQVTKKSKKNKAPLTPTSSTNSNNASSSQPNNIISSVISSSSKASDAKGSPVNPGSSGGSPLPSSSSHNPVSSAAASSSKSGTSKSRHAPHVSENAPLPAILSPSEPEPRRWSKADISYSEFDVVREPMFSANIANLGAALGRSRKSPESSSSYQHHPKPDKKHSDHRDSSQKKSSHKVQEVLDEDNYNVIPEPAHLPRSGRDASDDGKNRKVSSNSSNYQEIGDSYQLMNAYQEIDRKEPSDYYQEIGARVNDPHREEDMSSSNLYQEIDKKQPVVTLTTELDEDDDATDQFYETVKPTPSSSSKPKFLTSPSHSQGSVTSLDRKHGYEKLKKKGSGPPTVVIIASDDDDDDDEEEEEDDNKNEDSMYERVKYPPYERLKESRDDLRELPGDEQTNPTTTLHDRNLYEDIGYSRVKPKASKKRLNASVSGEVTQDISPVGSHESSNNTSSSARALLQESSPPSPLSSKKPLRPETESNTAEANDVDQLYARIDKSKKKKKDPSSSGSTSVMQATIATSTNSHTSTLVNHFKSNSNDEGSSSIITTTTTMQESHSRLVLNNKEDTPKACIVLRTDKDDNSIEYI